MDAIEAIYGRRSIRAFKPDPVPKDVLEKIMEAALRAPSWENTQPWEFIVLGGEAMDGLRKAVKERALAGEKPKLDIPWPKFSGPYRERERALGRRILPELGMSKEDREAMARWWFSMTQFFNAPNGIIVYIDSLLSEWSILDTGLALENLMIAAWHYGIGTCVMSASVIYPDLIRTMFDVPDSKRMIVGLAVGYPDLSSRAANFRTDREPIENLVKWYGVD